MLRPPATRIALRLLALATCGAALLRAAPERPSEPYPSLDPLDTPPYDVLADTDAPPAPSASSSAADTPEPAPAPAVAPAAKGDWVVAPIPGYNPSQGANIKVAAQYILPPDPDAPPDAQRSLFAVAGFYTQEDSRGVGLAYSGSLAADTWRVLAFAGVIRLNYDFYGVGTDAGNLGYSIPITQDMHVGLL